MPLSFFERVEAANRVCGMPLLAYAIFEREGNGWAVAFLCMAFRLKARVFPKYSLGPLLTVDSRKPPNLQELALLAVPFRRLAS